MLWGIYKRLLSGSANGRSGADDRQFLIRIIRTLLPSLGSWVRFADCRLWVLNSTDRYNTLYKRYFK